jgi:hypothetical protein
MSKWNKSSTGEATHDNNLARHFLSAGNLQTYMCQPSHPRGSPRVRPVSPFSKPRLRSPKGCATLLALSRRPSNRNSFRKSGPCRFSPSSLANLRASGRSRRLVFDTTTPCANCNGPTRSQSGWQRLSRRSRNSAAQGPGSGRFFVPNTTLGSASVGTATSPTSTGYSAFRLDQYANSGSADPPARHGIAASPSMPSPVRST